MSRQLQIAVVQNSPATGDFSANIAGLLQARAAAAKADLLVAPEQALCGSPLLDLAKSGAFQAAADAALQQLLKATADGGPAVLLSTRRRGQDALLLLDRGQATQIWPGPGVVDFRGVRLAAVSGRECASPAVQGRLRAADLVLITDARAFVLGGGDKVEASLQALALRLGRPLLYVNRAGAVDDLLFEGASVAVAADGKLRARLPQFDEAMTMLHYGVADGFSQAAVQPRGVDEAQIYQALTVSLRQYVARNRFKGVLLGMSGGMDSALVAAIAVDALGADKVWCVLLPSRFTSAASVADATECTRLLGARFDSIAIEPAVEAIESMLAPAFAGRPRDLTEENIQARLRMVTLMGLSNKFGPLLLSTGNKSEVAAGYGTLYGDMAGGYNVLKDVYKTMVFQLARWRNTNRPDFCLGPDGAVIPARIIEKPPSAELRDNQRDDDSLPPYEQLDPILHALIEERLSVAEVVAAGLADLATARRVEQLLFGAEYKRRQACPGPKISPVSFGREWRYPLTNAFRSGAAD